MTDRPTTPPEGSRDSRTKRPGVANADVPSDTVGLPGVGEGASAAHFARDTVPGEAGDGEKERDTHAPADPRDRAG